MHVLYALQLPNARLCRVFLSLQVLYGAHFPAQHDYLCGEWLPKAAWRHTVHWCKPCSATVSRQWRNIPTKYNGLAGWYCLRQQHITSVKDYQSLNNMTFRSICTSFNMCKLQDLLQDLLNINKNIGMPFSTTQCVFVSCIHKINTWRSHVYLCM